MQIQIHGTVWSIGPPAVAFAEPNATELCHNEPVRLSQQDVQSMQTLLNYNFRTYVDKQRRSSPNL